MYERFTDRARRAMQFANKEAQRLDHDYIGAEHVLLGLIEAGGVAAHVFKVHEVDLDKIRSEVEKLALDVPDMLTRGTLLRAKKVIEYAMEEARNSNHNCVGTEQILLGLMRQEETGAGQVLAKFGLTIEGVREEVMKLDEMARLLEPRLP